MGKKVRWPSEGGLRDDPLAVDEHDAVDRLLRPSAETADRAAVEPRQLRLLREARHIVLDGPPHPVVTQQNAAKLQHIEGGVQLHERLVDLVRTVEVDHSGHGAEPVFAAKPFHKPQTNHGGCADGQDIKVEALLLDIGQKGLVDARMPVVLHVEEVELTRPGEALVPSPHVDIAREWVVGNEGDLTALVARNLHCGDGAVSDEGPALEPEQVFAFVGLHVLQHADHDIDPQVAVRVIVIRMVRPIWFPNRRPWPGIAIQLAQELGVK
mmetsp:Transcript_6316/g.23725  ORF Transcript_6316/g.23725 Transcript_6316/m.23725 type:complete len:268 (-) Transcript_6316:304-1107(-)